MGRSEEAVRLALEGRWEEAVMANREIIEVSPGDVEAHNRLGKALAELGRNTEALEAYEQVLKLDRSNTIAQRNLQRLRLLKDGDRSRKEAKGIDCKLFIQDTSKARVVSLINAASRQTLAKMSAGDEVYLQPAGRKLEVVEGTGEYLGQVDPKVGSRLVELIKGGNEYKAAISSVRDDGAKVIIRETFRHPSQLKHPSFLPGTAEEVKPYLKGSLVKHDIEEEFLEDLGEPGRWEEDEEGFGPDETGSEDEALALEKGDASI